MSRDLMQGPCALLWAAEALCTLKNDNKLLPEANVLRTLDVCVCEGWLYEQKIKKESGFLSCHIVRVNLHCLFILVLLNGPSYSTWLGIMYVISRYTCRLAAPPPKYLVCGIVMS